MTNWNMVFFIALVVDMVIMVVLLVICWFTKYMALMWIVGILIFLFPFLMIGFVGAVSETIRKIEETWGR